MFFHGCISEPPAHHKSREEIITNCETSAAAPPSSEKLGKCAVCGDVIYAEDGHYRMPDGDLVCDFDRNCIGNFMQKYFVCGVFPAV